MKIYQKLRELFSALEPYQGSWAVCGGVAATIYRDTPRYTGDIDIAVVDRNSETASAVAEKVLTQVGYLPIAGFVPAIHEQALVVGRETSPTTFLGIDFLLPTVPWVRDAVERAQSNLLDYGFVTAPTITVEDLCLAKIMAFRDNPQRITDRDDLEAMVRAGHSMDRVYLLAQAERLKISLPSNL